MDLAPPREPAFLLIARDNMSPTVYPLEGQRHLIGRRSDAQIFIDHFSVSRTHATIEKGPSGRWWILDLGSTNGTFVNGVRIKERLIGRGDVIRIGDCTLTLRLASVIAFPVPVVQSASNGPDSVDAAPETRHLQRIGAEHLASIMGLGRSLMRLEEAQARLKAFCEFVVVEMCPLAIGALAVRVTESEEIRVLCGPFARGGSEKLKIDVDATSVRKLLDQNEAATTRASRMSEFPDRGTVAMIVPFASLGGCVDALYAEFPLNFGTNEWLTLVTLAAEAYQQAELVWDMRHQVRQNALIEGELEMACQIQTGLVPEGFTAPGLALAFGFEPCRWVGGDYVDAMMLPDGRVLLGIADVCGKGLQAALVASSLHTLVRASRELAGDLPRLMKRLNEYLLGYLPEHSFVTMMCVVINCQTGETDLVCAGHPGAIVVRAGGQYEILSEGDNVGLGIVPSQFQTLSIQLNVGDVLLLYTDGITEMVNLLGEPFGTDRLGLEFQRIVAVNPLASMDSMRHRLVDLCNAYRGSQIAADDSTFLIATRQSPTTIRAPSLEGAEAAPHLGVMRDITPVS